MSDFYLDAIRAVPDAAYFEVDDVVAGGSSCKVAAVW
jgi:hypothetical protein